jgi:hypothetical protein
LSAEVKPLFGRVFKPEPKNQNKKKVHAKEYKHETETLTVEYASAAETKAYLRDKPKISDEEARKKVHLMACWHARGTALDLDSLDLPSDHIKAILVEACFCNPRIKMTSQEKAFLQAPKAAKPKVELVINDPELKAQFDKLLKKQRRKSYNQWARGRGQPARRSLLLDRLPLLFVSEVGTTKDEYEEEPRAETPSS